jgi:hypothetical protein
MPPRKEPYAAVNRFLKDDAKKAPLRLFPGSGSIGYKARTKRLATKDGKKVPNWHAIEVKKYLDTGNYYDAENGDLMNDFFDSDKKMRAPEGPDMNKQFTDSKGKTWGSRLEYYEHICATEKAQAEKEDVDDIEMDLEEEYVESGAKSVNDTEDDEEDEDSDVKMAAETMVKMKAPEAENVKRMAEEIAKMKAIDAKTAEKTKMLAEAIAKLQAEAAEASRKKAEAAKREAPVAKKKPDPEVEADDEEPECELQDQEREFHVAMGDEDDDIDTIADLDMVVSGKPHEALMSRRTGRVCCASLLRCFKSGMTLLQNHPAKMAEWAKDDAATPSLTSPFWRNFSTIVFYDTASRVIVCTLYPTTFNNTPPSDTQDGHAIFYQDMSAMMIQTQPKTSKYTLSFTKSSLKVGAWTLDQSELGRIKPNTNTVTSSGPAAFTHPTECTFQNLTCRDSQDVASFFLTGQHGVSPRPNAFGWYLAQVEDIADDVYYHTHSETQEQYKCFHRRDKWRIVHFDNIGGYDELYTSEDTSAKSARHPRHVKTWTAHDPNIQIHIDMAVTHYKGIRLSLTRSQRQYETSVLPYNCDATMKFSLATLGLHDWYMQKFHNNTITYLKQGKVKTTKGTYQPNKPGDWPQALRSTTLHLIECMQEVVVFDLQTKQITATLSWVEDVNAFRSGKTISDATLRFSLHYDWTFNPKTDTLMKALALKTLHRQLPVVGKGFFLCADGLDNPTHYCTHARNVRGFTLTSHTFQPTHASQAGETYVDGDVSTSKSVASTDKYQWNVARKSEALFTSKPFAKTAPAYMHPIYAEFENKKAPPDKKLEKEKRAVEKERQRLKDEEQRIRKREAELKKKESKAGTAAKGAEIAREHVELDKLKKVLALEVAAHTKQTVGVIANMQKEIEQRLRVMASESIHVGHVRVPSSEETTRLHLQLTESVALASRLAMEAANATRVDTETRQVQFDNLHQRMDQTLLRAEQDARDRLRTFTGTLATLEQDARDRLRMFTGTLATLEQTATACTARVVVVEAALALNVAQCAALVQSIEAADTQAGESRGRALAAEGEAVRAGAAANEAAAALTEVQRQTNDQYQTLVQQAAARLVDATEERRIAGEHELAFRVAKEAAEAAARAVATAQGEAEAARTAAQEAQRAVATAQEDIEKIKLNTQREADQVRLDIETAKSDARDAATQAQEARTEAQTARKDAVTFRGNAKHSRDRADQDEKILKQAVERAAAAQAKAEAAHARELIAMRERDALRSQAQRAATNDPAFEAKIRRLDDAFDRAIEQTALLNTAAQNAQTEMRQLRSSRQSTPDTARVPAVSTNRQDEERILKLMRDMEHLQREVAENLAAAADISRNSIASATDDLQALKSTLDESKQSQEKMSLQIRNLKATNEIASARRPAQSGYSRRLQPPRGLMHASVEPEERPLPPSPAEVAPDHPLYDIAMSINDDINLMTCIVQNRMSSLDDPESIATQLITINQKIQKQKNYFIELLSTITDPTEGINRCTRWIDGEISASDNYFNAMLTLIGYEKDERARRAESQSIQQRVDSAVSGAIELLHDVQDSAIRDVAEVGLEQSQEASMHQLVVLRDAPANQSAQRLALKNIIRNNTMNLHLSQDFQHTFREIFTLRDNTLSTRMLRMMTPVLAELRSEDNAQLSHLNRISRILSDLRDVAAMQESVEHGAAASPRKRQIEDVGEDDENEPVSDPPLELAVVPARPRIDLTSMAVKKRITEFAAGLYVMGQDWIDPLENLDGPGTITTAENEVFPESTGWMSEVPRAARTADYEEFDPDEETAVAIQAFKEAKKRPMLKAKLEILNDELRIVMKLQKTISERPYTDMPDGAEECFFVILTTLTTQKEKIREQLQSIKTNMDAISQKVGKYSDASRNHQVTRLKREHDKTPKELLNVQKKAIQQEFILNYTPLRKQLDKLRTTVTADAKAWSDELHVIARQTKGHMQRKAAAQAKLIAIDSQIDECGRACVLLKRRTVDLPVEAKSCKDYIQRHLDKMKGETVLTLTRLDKMSGYEKEIAAWKSALESHPDGIALEFTTQKFHGSHEARTVHYMDQTNPIAIQEVNARYGILYEHFHKLKTIDWDNDGQEWTEQCHQIQRQIEIPAASMQEKMQWYNNTIDIEVCKSQLNRIKNTIPNKRWNSIISHVDNLKISRCKTDAISIMEDHIRTLEAKKLELEQTNTEYKKNPFDDEYTMQIKPSVILEAQARLKLYLDANPMVSHYLNLPTPPTAENFRVWSKRYTSIHNAAPSEDAEAGAEGEIEDVESDSPAARTPHKKKDPQDVSLKNAFQEPMGVKIETQRNNVETAKTNLADSTQVLSNFRENAPKPRANDSNAKRQYTKKKKQYEDKLQKDTLALEALELKLAKTIKGNEKQAIRNGVWDHLG